MGNEMNKIISSLYVGNFKDSQDQSQINLNKISHIISIHNVAQKNLNGIQYLCISIVDQPNQNLSQYFSQTNDFIHQARLTGGNVLIHCLAGVSRSVTITAAYMMSVTSLSAKDALKCIKGARAIANPNDGFLKQLQQFENTRLKEERRRLHKKFKGEVFRPKDEVEARKILKNQTKNLNQINYNNNTKLITVKKNKDSNWNKSKVLLKNNKINQDGLKKNFNPYNSKITINSPVKTNLLTNTSYKASTESIPKNKSSFLSRSFNNLNSDFNKTKEIDQVLKKKNFHQSIKEKFHLETIKNQFSNLSFFNLKSSSKQNKNFLNTNSFENQAVSAPASIKSSNTELNK